MPLRPDRRAIACARPACAPGAPHVRAAARALLAAGALAALAACDATDAVAPRPTVPTEPLPAGARGVPGFDIGVHPGAAALRAWVPPASPYRWVGYYLAAPCHRDASFMGTRAAIQALGYGLAVLYVGQQTWEGVPDRQPPDGGPLAARGPTPAATPAAALDGALAGPTLAAARALARGIAQAPTCSRTLLSAARGASEGADAVAKTAAEGFPLGTAVFLDLEPMTTIPAAMRDYYRAWFRAVLDDRRFRPAVYVHWRNAAEVQADLATAYAAAGVGTEPPVWVARSTGFALDRAPTDAGFAFATVWQGALDVRRSWNGVTLTIDENVATRASPSAP